MAPERLEPVAITDRGGKLGRDKDSVSQRLAQSLDAGDFVDSRPDDREVEAIGGADIAVQYLSDVEREVDFRNRLAGLGS